jgi:HemY protein
MFRIAVFILFLFGLATGFAWLADNPGTVTVQWPWLDKSVEVSLLQAVIAMTVIVLVIMMSWWVISGVLNSPKLFGRWRKGRRRDKGYAALSSGLVAAGAGNAPVARKLAKESGKFLENEPLVALLTAQTDLLEGKRADARDNFQSMLENEDTKLLGLRGLFIEAEREGEAEAAAHFASEAMKTSPGTPWASQAVLKSQALSGDWEAALKTLETNRASGIFDKPEYLRKRAVLLTAQALSEENSSPDTAKSHAMAAHKADNAFVPAAATASRIALRLDDTRRAGRVLETCWKQTPHPELAEAFVNLKPGDTAKEKLKRAKRLLKKAPDHIESQIIVAKAAIEASDFKLARESMENVLGKETTERACLIMADIEEAEHGDQGRVREWLSRAINAERDACWTADGIVSTEWKPFSPVTGKLDAFEWKTPVAEMIKSEAIDYSSLVHEPLPAPAPIMKPEADIVDVETTDKPAVEAAAATVAAATVVGAVADQDKAGADTVEDVEDTKSTDSAEEAVVEAEVVTTKEPSAEETENAAIKEEETDSAEGMEEDSETKAEKKPYENIDLDPDQDGRIDRHPDDPGIKEGEKPKKKGMFF